MNSQDIQNNIQDICDNFSKEQFIYDFLLAYGISKTSITRLKQGDFNLSNNDNEIFYKKKIFFKTETTKKLLSTIDGISKDQSILRHDPRFAIVIDYDYHQLVAKDLKLGRTLDIELKKLPDHFDFFLPLAGSEVYNASNDNEADRTAAYKMASLYDLLRGENPDIYNSEKHIHHLNIFLSRLLFCYFAEDTGIFTEENIFTNTLVQHTQDNGSDMHTFLSDLFTRLNTESAQEFADYLAKFPYVNGDLFKDKIEIPVFSCKPRKVLIELGELDWKNINPDIFGSMIQAVVDNTKRSKLGMHYTSVDNILKLIKPLFLDELYEVFEKSKNNEKQLQKLIARLSVIKFFDPACGSGNFLIITYKEIRVLEIEILQRIIKLTQASLFVESTVSLSQFYGIEIDDFAHEVAILSLWLAEHQMNQYFEGRLVGYTKKKSIIPLKKSGTIEQGNATRLDWEKVCPIIKTDEVYIIGNPPYLGASKLTSSQKQEIKLCGVKHSNKVDYVSVWFLKGVNYILDKNAKCAFVSTNSICQGEQVSLFWNSSISEKIEIDFAYPSFSWKNNAKGGAGVTVIIVGLRNFSKNLKYLFHGNKKNEVKNINFYLRNENNSIVQKTSNSNKIFQYPSPSRVSFIAKSNNLFFNEEEKNKNLNCFNEKYIRELICARGMLQGEKKYCLYIKDNDLPDAVKDDFIKTCLQKTKEERGCLEDSHKFCKKNISDKIAYLVIPRISSEKRNYFPVINVIGRYAFDDSVVIIKDPNPLIFAVLSSRMHMVWVRAVSGKLETRYRYSPTLCYNTFPFPEINFEQQENLNLYVYDILNERAKHTGKTMAWMYSPDTMPKGLKQAHQDLDTAIDQCYRLQSFKNDTERLEYLFKQYKAMLDKQKKSKKMINKGVLNKIKDK